MASIAPAGVTPAAPTPVPAPVPAPAPAPTPVAPIAPGAGDAATAQAIVNAVQHLREGQAGAEVLSQKIAGIGAGGLFQRGANIEMTLEGSKKALEITKGAITGARSDVEAIPAGPVHDTLAKMLDGSLGMWQQLGTEVAGELQDVPSFTGPFASGKLEQAQQAASMSIGNIGRLCQGTADAITAVVTGQPLPNG